jgi:hypothetical protein
MMAPEPVDERSCEDARAVQRRDFFGRWLGALSLVVGAVFVAATPACSDADPGEGLGSGGAMGTGRGGAGGSGGTDGKDAGGGSGGSGAVAGRGGTGGTAAMGGSAGSAGSGGAGIGGGAGTGGGGSGGAAGAGGGAGTGTGGNAGTGSPDSGRSGSDAGGGSGGSDGGAGMDGGMTIDARLDGAGGSAGAPPDGGTCTPVNPNDATITAYQSDIVGRLTGQTDITPGVRLVNRATAANRQTARDYLKRLFQDLTLTPLEHNYGTGTNVYAQLASTTGGAQTVVLGAHYDTVTVSPGANDNATGVAAVYAIARYATKLPCRSKALMFALFDEEEVGLVGSKQFATKLRSDSTMVHSVHTIDQMGWDQDGDRAIELELPDVGLRELYVAAATKLGVTIPMKNTTTASTDHSSFRPTFLAIGLTEEYTSGDTTPYYHRVGDTYDTVNFPYLLSTTVLVNQMIADLAR